MIGLNERSILTDALTPPAGYEFDTGIITTYSLDLVTLLGLPLHLAWMAASKDENSQLEPIAIIESMRRVAQRLTVFCQRAQINHPRTPGPLLGLLEPVVREVKTPTDGVFHPKLWLLKYVNPTAPPKLVLLVSSRNLTEDQSWDCCVRLDGQVGKKPIKANAPIRTLIEHAMRYATAEPEGERKDCIEALIRDASSANWELPGDFQDVEFHAIGCGRTLKPWFPLHVDGKWNELGVVSPFVADNALDGLSKTTFKQLKLVARDDELQGLKRTPAGFSCRVLKDTAAAGDEVSEEVAENRGLHAKLYVAQKGWNTHLFAGSANATVAALSGRNTEFMVELIGRASKVGRPDDLFGEKGIGSLLIPFIRQEDWLPEDKAVEEELEALRLKLSMANLAVRCESSETGWSMRMDGVSDLVCGRANAMTWPITLLAQRALTLSAEKPVEFSGLQPYEITSIMAFKLSLQSKELCFSMSCPLYGAPEDRELELLRSVLKNRAAFMRYLALLLGDWATGDALHKGKGGKARGGSFGSQGDMPLFESMAKALSEDPGRLRHVQEVIERLKAEEGTQQIIPADFDGVWRQFESVLREESK